MPHWDDERDRDWRERDRMRDDWRYDERYSRLDSLGRRLDEAWDRLDETRERIARERERLRYARERMEDFRPRDDDRWRDRGYRGDDRDDRYYPDIHLEPWRGPQDWNRRRGADWRGPDPHDFDMPPRRRR